MDSTSNDKLSGEILEQLKSFETRITRIENYLNLASQNIEESPADTTVKKTQAENEEEFEYRIGQYWFAKLGVFVFLVGCVITCTLPFESLHQIIPSAACFLTGIILIALSQFLKKRIPHLFGYISGSGLLIIYLAILRLHFFSHNPAVSKLIYVLPFLYIFAAVIIITGIKRDTPYITSLGIFTVLVSALSSDNSYLIFFTLMAVSVLGIYLKSKYNWQVLLNTVMLLTYFVHLIWFVNNPVIGNELKFVTDVPVNLVFILLYQVIFSIPFLYEKNYEENLLTSAGILINASIGYGLFLLISVLTMPAFAQLYHYAVSVIFLSLAILFLKKKSAKLTTFFYAMTGYGALSVGIIFQFSSPAFFVWLCWQSILVVSTAILFRSKFIIIANFFIYLMIFIAFLVMSGATSGVSLNFGIVALISARLLNWKKDQLELTTDQMRMAYLLTAFLIIPYSLYQMFPGELVALSWIVVAILYYVLSIILKNTKYRWMSIATFLLTVGYVFILGITSSETSYKILSFLVLGITLVILSILYAKNRSKSAQKVNTGQKY